MMRQKKKKKSILGGIVGQNCSKQNKKSVEFEGLKIKIMLIAKRQNDKPFQHEVSKVYNV
jgi:hypothetical protein